MIRDVADPLAVVRARGVEKNSCCRKRAWSASSLDMRISVNKVLAIMGECSYLLDAGGAWVNACLCVLYV